VIHWPQIALLTAALAPGEPVTSNAQGGDYAEFFS
jgi:hypothetical protein